MNYKRISYEDRVKIEVFLNEERKTITQIAKILKRNYSTIYRELKRNVDHLGFYKAEEASLKSSVRFNYRFTFKFLTKYDEFTNLFKKFYDKRVHGVKATWTKINQNYPTVFKVSWRQVFRWIKINFWIIDRKID